MIETLLGKIAGLFEKDFLFASFLPALIFSSALVATFATVVGIDSMWDVVDSLPALQKTALTAVASLCIVIFAYLLNSLRVPFTNFWSGTTNFPFYIFWGIFRLWQSFHRLRFRKLEANSLVFSHWMSDRDFFADQVDALWDNGKPPPSRWALWKLHFKILQLQEDMASDFARTILTDISQAFSKYSGEALSPFYEKVNKMLGNWHDQEKQKGQTAGYALDRRFGRLETIKPTKLGNIIESYNQYSFKRYKIEAEIFWPRLQRVIKPEYLKLVEEPKILLDFSLAMASLGFLYGFLALLVGPWLFFSLRFWLTLAFLGFLSGFCSYRLSISAANSLGEMIRASFDLFRLDLMEALELPHPASFRVEQKQWEEFSKLTVYGENSDFRIRERKPS